VVKQVAWKQGKRRNVGSPVQRCRDVGMIEASVSVTDVFFFCIGEKSIKSRIVWDLHPLKEPLLSVSLSRNHR